MSQLSENNILILDPTFPRGLKLGKLLKSHGSVHHLEDRCYKEEELLTLKPQVLVGSLPFDTGVVTGWRGTMHTVGDVRKVIRERWNGVKVPIILSARSSEKMITQIGNSSDGILVTNDENLCGELQKILNQKNPETKKWWQLW